MYLPGKAYPGAASSASYLHGGVDDMFEAQHPIGINLLSFVYEVVERYLWSGGREVTRPCASGATVLSFSAWSSIARMEVTSTALLPLASIARSSAFKDNQTRAPAI